MEMNEIIDELNDIAKRRERLFSYLGAILGVEVSAVVRNLILVESPIDGMTKRKIGNVVIHEKEIDNIAIYHYETQEAEDEES